MTPDERKRLEAAWRKITGSQEPLAHSGEDPFTEIPLSPLLLSPPPTQRIRRMVLPIGAAPPLRSIGLDGKPSPPLVPLGKKIAASAEVMAEIDFRPERLVLSDAGAWTIYDVTQNGETIVDRSVIAAVFETSDKFPGSIFGTEADPWLVEVAQTALRFRWMKLGDRLEVVAIFDGSARQPKHGYFAMSCIGCSPDPHR